MPEGLTSSDPHRWTQSRRPWTHRTHRCACLSLFQLQLTHTKKELYKQPQATLISRVTQADTRNDTVVHTGQLTTKQTVCGANKGSGQTNWEKSGVWERAERKERFWSCVHISGICKAQPRTRHKSNSECGPRHIHKPLGSTAPCFSPCIQRRSPCPAP